MLPTAWVSENASAPTLVHEGSRLVETTESQSPKHARWLLLALLGARLAPVDRYIVFARYVL